MLSVLRLQIKISAVAQDKNEIRGSMEQSHCAHCDMSSLIKQTLVAAFIAMPLFIGTMFHIISEPNTTTGYWINWISAIASLIVLVYSGGHYFNGAWQSLLSKSYNMDTLTAIGTGMTWVYSVLILIFINHLPTLAQHVYFESTVIVITLVNLGTILEQRARCNTKKSIEALLQLQPNTSKIISGPQELDVADQIAVIFVPVVIIIAIFTALVWYMIGKEPVLTYMLITSMSVLIIACPCALGLAVPISFIIGIGKAAQSGILIRDVKTLKTSCNINTVILEKTGTITLGKPKVTEIIALHGINPSQVLSIAASLEFGSEHPYALAILTAAKEKGLNFEVASNFQNFAGLGINGTVAENSACIGNRGFMEAQLVKIDVLRDKAKNFAKTGATAIYVARGKQLIGLLILTDPIKTEVKFLVQKLHDMQIRVIMITGDQQSTADAIAEQTGITEVIADVMPQEKVNKIAFMQQESDEIIAMIGDGTNDAPALAQADVSFAMSNGTDVAMQTADITLINGSLDNIVETIYISRATVNNMKQNLFGALIFNIIGIPIAAGVLFPFLGLLLNPMLAAAAMALSLITIVANASRLRLLKHS